MGKGLAGVRKFYRPNTVGGYRVSPSNIFLFYFLLRKYTAQWGFYFVLDN